MASCFRPTLSQVAVVAFALTTIIRNLIIIRIIA
jgi:hypothetical protein